MVFYLIENKRKLLSDKHQNTSILCNISTHQVVFKETVL